MNWKKILKVAPIARLVGGAVVDAGTVTPDEDKEMLDEKIDLS